MIRFLWRTTLLMLLLVACNQKVPEPTPTQNWPTPDGPTVAPSATVNPLPPMSEGDEIHDLSSEQGVSNPTLAALPAEGQPDEDNAPTLTPAPTQVSLPMSISSSDGRILEATFYGANQRPAPGILLVHMEDRDRHSWDDLAGALQQAGYSVLTFDLRGYGDTGGTVDWSRAPDDVKAALDLLRQMPDVGSSPVAVIGAGIGANLGLNACGELASCAAVVLLSPGVDYQGITTADGMARLGPRPILIIAGENDNNNPADSMTLDRMAAGDHQLLIYPNAGHGTDIFAAQPGLSALIVGWLIPRITPPNSTPTQAP